jgi:SAM-dependent methyltransferase
MHLTHRETCRVCKSSHLVKVIDLGDQYLQGSFVKPGTKPPPQRKIPTTLVRCDPMADEHACGLLQMAHSVPPEILYSSYWYRSGTNSTMRNHLAGIADEASGLVKNPKARVLDIGCNDGTLLSAYPASYARFGIDPSEIAREISDGVTVINDFFPSPRLRQSAGTEGFDVVTSIAMFYDLEDPVTFVKEVQSLLAADGIWIFEMSYMPLMLQMNSYDTICHEHLEYYSLAVLENIVKRAGMKVIRASLNNINGGSIRCTATRVDSFKFDDPDATEQLAELRRSEFDLELDTDKPYKHFQDRIEGHREELRRLVTDIRTRGERVHLYGASTKGNTILQWVGLDQHVIEAAAERNPGKYGASTLGTGIPIVSEAESRAMKPDYYLVLPWHFREEFLERERATIASGIRMIFPLPEISVVGT